MSVAELLLHFFHFYTCVFDWRCHAVCIRLSRPGVEVDKYSLKTPTNDHMWYVEDPFDLKHNLAGKCTRAGRNRILDEMRSSLAAAQQPGGWAKACPAITIDSFFLKCRITMGVTPQALLDKFEDCELVKLHFLKPDNTGRMGQAYLEFSLAASRRRAHAKNDSYIMDCQLQLHYSNQHSLQEAMNQGLRYSTYEMASYQMQRQVLAARVGGFSPQSFSPLEQESAALAPQRPPATFGAATARPAHGFPEGPRGLMLGLLPPGTGAGGCGGEAGSPFSFQSGPRPRGLQPFPPHLAMQHMAGLASPWLDHQAAAQATAASTQQRQAASPAVTPQQAAQQLAQGAAAATTAQQQQQLQLTKGAPTCGPPPPAAGHPSPQGAPTRGAPPQPETAGRPEPAGRPDERGSAAGGRPPPAPAKGPGGRPRAAGPPPSAPAPAKGPDGARLANDSRTSQATQAASACWVSVPIDFDGVLPEGSERVFDEELSRNLKAALEFCKKHTVDNKLRDEETNPKPTGDYHTLHLEVSSGTTPGQGSPFSTEFSKLLQDTQVWFDEPQHQARKLANGAVNGVSKTG